MYLYLLLYSRGAVLIEVLLYTQLICKLLVCPERLRHLQRPPWAYFEICYIQATLAGEHIIDKDDDFFVLQTG